MSHLLIPFFCCEVQDLFFAGWRWGCCQQKDPWLLLSVDISLQLSLQSYWLWREKLDWTQRRKSKEASAQNSRCVNYFLHCWKLFLCVCVSRLLLEVCINYSEYTKDSAFLRGNVSTCCGFPASPVFCRVSLMKDDPAVTDPERTRSNYRTKATYFSHLHG